MPRLARISLAVCLCLAAGGSLADGIQYTGGDGSTVARAIVIDGAQGEDDGVKAEYDWLAANRAGWKLTDQELFFSGGKPYDVLSLIKSGERSQVFFDISGYSGRN